MKEVKNIEYWYRQFLEGVPLKKDILKRLKYEGYDLTLPEDNPVKEDKKKKKYNFKPKRDMSVKTPIEIRLDEKIEVLVSDEPISESKSDEFKKGVRVRKQGRVSESDWRPESVIYHTKAFYDWIDSINSGWLNRKEYEPFNLYVQQADDWLAENKYERNFETQEEVDEFQLGEFYKCMANKLYACNKYGWLADPSEPTGRRKYVAGEDYIHHRVLLYLFDCGYSIILGKPRQIGTTSIIGLATAIENIFKKNNFTKFITEDKDTGTEIFNDKILYPYFQLPKWFRAEDPLNFTNNLFKISQNSGGAGSRKARKGAASAKIEVVAPSRTAINGGSPQRVLIDEIGSISILGDMVNEARPTMFVKGKDGKLYQRRVIFLWGTGTTAKGGAAYEKEWNRINGLWNIREPQVGIVPLFFDWHTRCDEEHYIAEKKYYYGARANEKNMDVETSKIQFHQHFPSSPSDMFVQVGKTLISRESIDGHLNRINKELRRTGYTLEYGYFEPIYDLTKKIENQDLPFKVIGANFVKCGTEDDNFSTIIFEPPNKDWKYRYYAGTDPISSDTGSSRMATAIWDEFRHTVACLVNVREANNPNYSFLQCMLATIYYDPINNEGVPEIVERNIGLSYRNYRETKGFWKSLMITSQIDPYFQSGENYDVGIDNKGHRARQIINKLGECLNMFGDNIYIPVFFNQLITFVCTIGRSGVETWASIDKRYYMDDTLFALVYSFIAAQSIKKQPIQISESDKKNIAVKYVLALDSNNNVYHKPVTTTCTKK